MSGGTPVFVLLTDFGLADPYAGQLKAALFSRAPDIPILDLSHEVPPFSVPAGAFFLAASRRYYPKGAIFICAVDPGVGSKRDLLCITNEGHTLLGPDNGLLALAYRDMVREGAVSVHALTHTAPETADTFHGRDVLAPAAAALALGTGPGDIGARPREGLDIPDWATARHESGEILCTVLHVDRFGNAILNLPNGDDRLLYPRLSLYLPRTQKSTPLHQAGHYAELAPGTLGLLPGGQGFYEIAMAQASAAGRLRITPGDVCVIRGDLWGQV